MNFFVSYTEKDRAFMSLIKKNDLQISLAPLKSLSGFRPAATDDFALNFWKVQKKNFYCREEDVILELVFKPLKIKCCSVLDFHCIIQLLGKTYICFFSHLIEQNKCQTCSPLKRKKHYSATETSKGCSCCESECSENASDESVYSTKNSVFRFYIPFYETVDAVCWLGGTSLHVQLHFIMLKAQ